MSDRDRHVQTEPRVQHRHTVSDRTRFNTLFWTQRQPGTKGAIPDPKPRIQRFSECGVEGVKVDQFVRGDTVEGQSPSRTVHIHCKSVRDRGEGQAGVDFSIVIDRVTIIMKAGQTPGLIVLSKHTVFTLSFPVDSSVTH